MFYRSIQKFKRTFNTVSVSLGETEIWDLKRENMDIDAEWS